MKKTNTIFDKIYILSFVYNSKKRKTISNYLTKKLGIKNFEFIYGIDANISNIHDVKCYDVNIMEKPYIEWHNRDKTNSYHLHDISCSLGHLSIYQVAYSEGYEKILIIEDDSIFIDNIPLILEYFNNVPEDANIVYYGYKHNYGFEGEHYNHLYNKLTNYINVAGTNCYGIFNNETLRKIIDYNEKNKILSVSDQYLPLVTDNQYIAKTNLLQDENFER